MPKAPDKMEVEEGGSETDEPVARPADKALNLAEDVVYILAGLLLLGGAVAVLVAVGVPPGQGRG